MFTRAQLRRQAEEEREQETREARHKRGETVPEEERGAGGSELEETSEGTEEDQDGGEGDGCAEVLGDGVEKNYGVEFVDDLFLPLVQRQKLSRAQKRVERHAHGLERVKDRPDGRS